MAIVLSLLHNCGWRLQQCKLRWQPCVTLKSSPPKTLPKTQIAPKLPWVGLLRRKRYKINVLYHFLVDQLLTLIVFLLFHFAHSCCHAVKIFYDYFIVYVWCYCIQSIQLLYSIQILFYSNVFQFDIQIQLYPLRESNSSCSCYTSLKSNVIRSMQINSNN